MGGMAAAHDLAMPGILLDLEAAPQVGRLAAGFKDENGTGRSSTTITTGFRTTATCDAVRELSCRIKYSFHGQRRLFTTRGSSTRSIRHWQR